MEKRLEYLERLAASFQREAGLLTVPPAIQKQVEDYVIGCYADYVVNAVNAKLSVLASRVRDHQSMKQSLAHYTKGLQIIEDFVEGEGISKWEPFYQWVESSQFNKIPFFQEYAIDEESGLSGTVDFGMKHRSLLNISMAHLGEGKGYNFWIEIVADGHALEHHGLIENTHIALKGVGPKEIKHALGEEIGALRDIVMAYEDAVRYFETYSEQSLRQLHMTRALFEQRRVTKDWDGKKFLIPIREIPYFAELKLPVENIEFKASFVTNPSDQKMISDYEGGWLGLWSARNITLDEVKTDLVKQDRLPLGTVYVYRNVKEEFAEGISAGDRKDALDELRDTVRHELLHMLQWAFKHLKSLTEIGGVPSRKFRDKNLDVHGRPLDELKVPVDPKKRVEHELRDVEFYTRLSDTVHEFQRARTILPLSMHAVMARAWVSLIERPAFREILKNAPELRHLSTSERALLFNRAESMIYNHGERNFFSNLKAQQPLKFQKAVKEFMKAIQ